MKTKQLISILLILTLMLSLCGCGMSKEAKAAQALIDGIGEVSLDSESAIVAAEEAVAALSDKDRERLTGLDTLKKARETFNELSDADKLAAVESLIDGIGTVDLDSRAAIDAAREAYDALDDRLKEKVGNAGLIEQAEAAYEQVRLTADAFAIEGAIAAIGEVTTDSAEAIEAAKALYEAAPAEVQALIGNFAALEEAESALNEIREAETAAAEEERQAAEAAAEEEARLSAEAAAVEEAIAAIGEVTADSAEAIEKAKALYEAAPAEVQALIGNAAALTEAETALDEIREAEAAAAAEEERLSAEAAAVEEAIAAIGEVTADSAEAIENAKALYEAAPAEVRERVGNAAALTEAETALADARLTAEAAAVEEAIAAIGEVTADSAEAIENAKALFEAAPAEVQAKVSNASVIAEAEAAYEDACLEAEAAAVEEAIAAIGEVTTDSAEAIENAKALYDALPAEVQAKVDNASALTEAEAAYEDACLEAEAAPVEAAIAAIGEITLDSGEAIENAKALYDALPAEVQAKVDNAPAIDEAKSAFSALRVGEAEKRIAEIGEVTTDSGEAIAAAQAALDALTPEEAAAVGNASILTEAGESYQTALEDRAAELLDSFRLAEDESGNEKIYYPAGWTFYGENPAMNQRSFIRPYIKLSGDSPELRVVYNYTSPVKIYWTGINIYVDDETFSKSFPDEEIVRGHSAGTIWEYYDDAADMDLLQAITNAERTVWFYFVSPAGLSNYRLSRTDVEAIRQTLEAYDAMLAAGMQPAA